MLFSYQSTRQTKSLLVIPIVISFFPTTLDSGPRKFFLEITLSFSNYFYLKQRTAIWVSIWRQSNTWKLIWKHRHRGGKKEFTKLIGPRVKSLIWHICKKITTNFISWILFLHLCRRWWLVSNKWNSLKSGKEINKTMNPNRATGFATSQKHA